MTPLQLDGWIPIRIASHGKQPMVDWCHMGTRRFTEPFFDQTVEAALRDPFSLLFRHQTPIDALLEWQVQRPGLYPRGFIFHMSRCGSTLIAQMLAALPQNIVLSEASPIDKVLRAPFLDSPIEDELRIAWLRGLVSALGQPRNGEQQLFIKFDCWHAMELPLIQRAFPDVPWIFLYRDPVEVLVSHVRQPGSQMIPGMLGLSWPGLDVSAAHQMPREEYFARVLSQVCQAAAQQLVNGTGKALNYRQLPDAVWSILSDHFHLDFSAADFDRLRPASQVDSKAPYQPFANDSPDKQRQASDLVRQVAARWLEPVYAQLEAVRTAD